MAVVRLDFGRRHDRGGPQPSHQRIGHRLLFASEEAVEAAVRHLRRHRFDVEVRRNEDGRCAIVAAHVIAPTSAVMEQVVEFFEDLARDHAGEYGGWTVMDEGRA